MSVSAAINPPAVVSDPDDVSPSVSVSAAINPLAVVSAAINPSAAVSDLSTAVSVPDVIDWAQDVLLQVQVIDSCHPISVPCGLLQQLLASGRCIIYDQLHNFCFFTRSVSILSKYIFHMVP